MAWYGMLWYGVATMVGYGCSMSLAAHYMIYYPGEASAGTAVEGEQPTGARVPTGAKVPSGAKVPTWAKVPWATVAKVLTVAKVPTGAQKAQMP